MQQAVHDWGGLGGGGVVYRLQAVELWHLPEIRLILIFCFVLN